MAFQHIGNFFNNAAREVGRVATNVGNEVGNFASNAGNEIVKVANNAGNEIGKAFSHVELPINQPYSQDLNSLELVQLLVACSLDSYSFDNQSLGSRLTRIHQVWEDENKLIQYGVYRINDGEFCNQTIIGLKGTDSMMGFLQDIDMIVIGERPLIRQAIEASCLAAQQNQVNWVCGHSLGGFLAECVCAGTGIGGASFNAPATRKTMGAQVLPGHRYIDARFEVHLTTNDPISFAGCILGPNSSHIARPKWHEHGGGHSIEALRNHIGVL